MAAKKTSFEYTRVAVTLLLASFKIGVGKIQDKRRKRQKLIFNVENFPNVLFQRKAYEKHNF